MTLKHEAFQSINKTQEIPQDALSPLNFNMAGVDSGAGGKWMDN
jgi:hypothetical protein